MRSKWCKLAYCSHHGDAMPWKRFPCYWPFVRGIQPVNGGFLSQKDRCGALISSFFLFRLKCWAVDVSGIWCALWIMWRHSNELVTVEVSFHETYGKYSKPCDCWAQFFKFSKDSIGYPEPVIDIVMKCNIDKLLTHWSRDKMAAIFETFSNGFSWMKMYEFRLKFHWNLCLGV